jgi:hypothetical protein
MRHHASAGSSCGARTVKAGVGLDKEQGARRRTRDPAQLNRGSSTSGTSKSARASDSAPAPADTTSV